MTDGVIKVKVRQDLIGRHFGRLTVISRGPDLISNKGTRRAAWYCLCSCGNPEKLLISGDVLKQGHSKSCGCLKKETYLSNNTYDLTGEYGVCITHDGQDFIFDLEDYDKIKQHCWRITPRGYVQATLYNPDKPSGYRTKNIFLHRYLMNVDSLPWQKTVVDHINGDKKDNRKENLRIVTQSNNGMNSKVSKNNTSGVPGISKYRDKWVAYITYKTERIYLGIFNTFEEAVTVRRNAEEKYFGEYSYTNSQIRSMDNENN